MRQQKFDLREYLERHWTVLGRQLQGKLHFYCGDEDGGYFNFALYLLQDFLKNADNPTSDASFTWGRPLKGHGCQPMTNAELVEMMAVAKSESSR